MGGRQTIWLRPNRGQSDESVRRDVEASFALGERLAAAGTQEWRSRYRWCGPLKFMAYKEVGPPPWRWPRVAIQRKRGGRMVRFIMGWRSTAYALCVLWAGTYRSHGEWTADVVRFEWDAAAPDDPSAPPG